jgi:CHAT domain-containing protein/tetratricopeptide (TPR) repeat protein
VSAPVSPGEEGAAQLASAALAMVGADPRAAVAAAADALACARAQRNRAAASTALRALGLARKEVGDVPGALTSLRQSVREAQAAGQADAQSEARTSLAFVLLDRGQIGAALRQANAAEAAVRGVARARVRAQRGLILQRCGRLDDALEDYRAALPVLQRAGDLAWQARLRNNRGLLHAYRGALGLAEADLEAAKGLYRRLGQDLMAADAEWNLGFVAARRGDIPSALARYDRTQRMYDGGGIPLPELLVDRAELLLAAGLAGEAQEAAARAAEQLRELGRDTDLAEALLLTAQCALAAGDVDSARQLAGDAGRRFGRQRRTGWKLVAEYVALRASTAGPPAALYRSARRTAEALETHGWRVLATDVRIIAGQAALRDGDVARAREQLARTTTARRHGTVDLRVRAWHAEALLRSASGRRSAVEPALLAGLRALDGYRASLGATELRVQAATYGGELAKLGLSLAVADANPRRALAWTEQWRAGTLRLRPVRPPEDAALAESLAELRAVSAELERALLDESPVARLRARQAALERGIQAAARRTAGTGVSQRHEPAGAEALQALLGERALVSYFSIDDQLRALVCTDADITLHDLGPCGTPARVLEMLHFTLRRLASGAGSQASLAAAVAAARRSADALDDVLLTPLRARLADRPAVVVPTAALHGVPWGLLRTSARVPLVVAPSATVWHRADARPAGGTCGAGLLVAGPRLAAAGAEVAQIAAVRPHAQILVGDDAAVSRVTAALETAEWAHLATHGHLRSDNPLFSSLELADGSLTVYDLECLARVPQLVALPACQSGVGSVRGGEEVLGMATALLALGTRTLIATVIPVPDVASRFFMIAMHDRLAAGDPPAVALSRARMALDPDDPAGLAAAAGFVCLGAG